MGIYIFYYSFILDLISGILHSLCHYQSREVAVVFASVSINLATFPFCHLFLPPVLIATCPHCHLSILPPVLVATNPFCHLSFLSPVLIATSPHRHLSFLPPVLIAIYLHCHLSSSPTQLYLPPVLIPTCPYCHLSLLSIVCYLVCSMRRRASTSSASWNQYCRRTL